MLKPCRPTEPSVRVSSQRSVEHGTRRVQEFTRARGITAHAKPAEVEAARCRQAARNPLASRQGPRPGNQSRHLEAEGLGPSGSRAFTREPQPGKSAGETPLST